MSVTNAQSGTNLHEIAEGIYRDLGVSISSLEQLDSMRDATFERREDLRPAGNMPA